MDNGQPSRAYLAALAEATSWHASSKTYSGKFLRPHAAAIKRLLDETGADSVLDYGCGKGQQYDWRSEGKPGQPPAGMNLEEYWGVPVFKFDPAWPPLAQPEPEAMIQSRTGKRFGVTLATYVLGSIPIFDLVRWVIPRLADITEHAVYIAERAGAIKKKVFSDPAVLPHWPAPYWSGLVQAASSLHPRVAWYLVVHEREGDEKVMRVQAWRGGAQFLGGSNATA